MFKYLFFLFFFISSILPAQELYTINESGTYIAYDGIIKRVPTEHDTELFMFWRNYAVFTFKNYDIDLSGALLIFNIDNGTTRMLESNARAGGIKIIENNGFLTIFWRGVIYKLDSISLEIIENNFVGQIFKDNELDRRGEWEYPIYTRLTNQLGRFITSGNYIDINFSTGIDRLNGVTVFYSRNLRRYYISVYINNWGRE